jgi:hypothetical protein
MVDWTAVSGVATAAGSVIGAGALVVAALTLISEGRHWRADRLRAEQERHAAEQGLASFVSAVTESSDGDSAVVAAVNDGDRPVFNVRVTSERGATLIRRSDDGPLDEAIRRLNPGQRVSLTFRALPGEAEFSGPLIDFFDMEGRRWLRRGFGPPQRRTGWWDEEVGPLRKKASS